MTGLAACDATTPDWSIARAENHAAGDLDWFHTWKAPGGQVAMRVARAGEHYVLEFPGLARFGIDFSRRQITAQGMGECTGGTLAHLLLDQVLPRAVCHEGRMVVHASSVEVGHGQALAFTGVSGRGKSTLAAAFHRAGYRLLADDCLLLENRDGCVYAIPAYSSIRLWPAAADELFTESEQGAMGASKMAHYTAKRILQVQPVKDADTGAGLSLSAIFLLECPPPTADGREVRIEPTRGMAAIMTLVEAQFALDLVDPAAVGRGFTAVSDVAGHVPVYRASYARSFGRLPTVLEELLNAARLVD